MRSSLDLEQLLNVFYVFLSFDFDKEPAPVMQLGRLFERCPYIFPELETQGLLDLIFAQHDLGNKIHSLLGAIGRLCLNVAHVLGQVRLP